MYKMLFRFPYETKKFLKKEADDRGQTLTALIKQILWEWIEKQKSNKN